MDHSLLAAAVTRVTLRHQHLTALGGVLLATLAIWKVHQGLHRGKRDRVE